MWISIRVFCGMKMVIRSRRRSGFFSRWGFDKDWFRTDILTTMCLCLPVIAPPPLAPRTRDDDEVDPENQEFVEINQILSDHYACMNSIGLEHTAWQSALFESVETTVFPEGLPEKFHNASPRTFPGHVYSEEPEVEEYKFISRCHCGHVGIPRSRCDNCRNPFILPMGICVACSVAGTAYTV